MKLIPMPRLLHQTEEIIRSKSVCFNGTAVDPRLEKAIRKLPGHPEGLPLCLRVGSGDAENYCLDVTNDEQKSIVFSDTQSHVSIRL